MEQFSTIAEDKNLAILILTAAASTENRIRALKAGANDFVSKPFDATEIKLRIHNVLETKQLRNRLQNNRLTDIFPDNEIE